MIAQKVPLSPSPRLPILHRFDERPVGMKMWRKDFFYPKDKPPFIIEGCGEKQASWVKEYSKNNAYVRHSLTFIHQKKVTLKKVDINIPNFSIGIRNEKGRVKYGKQQIVLYSKRLNRTVGFYRIQRIPRSWIKELDVFIDLDRALYSNDSFQYLQQTIKDTRYDFDF